MPESRKYEKAPVKVQPKPAAVVPEEAPAATPEGDESEFALQTKALLARRAVETAGEPPQNAALGQYATAQSNEALAAREGVWTNPSYPPEKADLTRNPWERAGEARDIDVEATKEAIDAGRTQDKGVKA